MLRSTITQIGVPDDRSQSALKAGMLRSQMWHVNGKLHRVSIRPQSGDAAQLEWRSFDAFMIVSQSALKAGKLRSARRKPLSPSRCLNPPSKRGCCAAMAMAGVHDDVMSQSALKAGMLRSAEQCRKVGG